LLRERHQNQDDAEVPHTVVLLNGQQGGCKNKSDWKEIYLKITLLLSEVIPSVNIVNTSLWSQSLG